MTLHLVDDYLERVVATWQIGEAIKYAVWERQWKDQDPKDHGKEVDEARQLDVCVPKKRTARDRHGMASASWGSLEFGG